MKYEITNKLIFVGLFTTTLLTTGCTLNHEPNTCEQLKRQEIYYKTNPNIEAAMTTGSQKEALKEKLNQMKCD